MNQNLESIKTSYKNIRKEASLKTIIYFLLSMFSIAFFLPMLIWYMVLVFPLIYIIKDWPIKKRMKIVTPIWKILSRIILTAFAPRIKHIDRRIDQGNPIPNALMICNHISMVDIPLIYAYTTIPPIMKKEVLNIPIFGLLGQMSGAIPVDRSNPNSRRKTLELAIERITKIDFGLFYFPEGTRSKSGVPKDFSVIKTKLIELAYKNNVKVIPVSLYGTNNTLGKIGNIKLFQKLGIIYQREIFPSDFENAQDFAKACWDSVLSGNEDLAKICN